jgi:hypothetical protein
LNVTQLAFDEAAHVQLPDVFVTVTLNAPPSDVGVCAVVETVYWHVAGAVGVVGDESLLHAASVAHATSMAAQHSFIGTSDSAEAAKRAPISCAVSRPDRVEHRRARVDSTLQVMNDARSSRYGRAGPQLVGK